LQQIQPPIRRRLQVPRTTTLAQLHGVIQDAMGWQDYHLYRFTIRDATLLPICHLLPRGFKPWLSGGAGRRQSGARSTLAETLGAPIGGGTYGGLRGVVKDENHSAADIGPRRSELHRAPPRNNDRLSSSATD
jgi:hypothetical protein